MIVKRIANILFGISVGAAALVLLVACSSKSNESGARPSADSTRAEYHADYDIAMTLRSAADAIQVGEPLDTSLYNFEGILTDGEGRPLYTNIQGLPGNWEIDVLSPTSIEIRNLEVGDLLPDYLKTYLLAAVDVTAMNLVHSYSDEEDEFDTEIYGFDGGFLRMETRKQMAPNGIEGSLMRIIATKDLPNLN